MKLIIAGSRTFSNYKLLEEKAKGFIRRNRNSALESITIVSGDAPGTDKLGNLFAERNKYKLKIFKADWDQYGKAAGPIRNKDMAIYGTHLLAISVNDSRGTANMISWAKRWGLIIEVVKLSSLFCDKHGKLITQCRDCGGNVEKGHLNFCPNRQSVEVDGH